MMKPIIGILGNLLMEENNIFAGTERSYVSNDYIESVQNAGGVPIIIPPNNDEDTIEKQIDILDGVLISGGYDVAPYFYGEEPKEKLGFVHPLVDEFTIRAIKAAIRLNKPVLGICKGIQILNVAFGGTLYQDLSYIPGSFVKHGQNAQSYEATHLVEVEKESILYQITQGDIRVNSFHHQAVNEVADGFKITARAKDGVIEAIEKRDGKFIMAVQWHPEMMAAKSEIMRKLFQRFIEESKK